MSFGNPTILSSVSPFSSYPQSFPASESFLMSAHPIRWPKYWLSDSASVLPVNYQDWFPLGVTGLISLLSKGLSRVFSSTIVQKHQFFGPQSSLWSNSHIHIWIWGGHNSVHSTIYRESSLGKGGIKDAVKISPSYWNEIKLFHSSDINWVSVTFDWRRKWQPTPVFLPRKSYGQRNLVGYSLWGHKDLDTTEWWTLSHSRHSRSLQSRRGEGLRHNYK